LRAREFRKKRVLRLTAKDGGTTKGTKKKKKKNRVQEEKKGGTNRKVDCQVFLPYGENVGFQGI